MMTQMSTTQPSPPPNRGFYALTGPLSTTQDPRAMPQSPTGPPCPNHIAVTVLVSGLHACAERMTGVRNATHTDGTMLEGPPRDHHDVYDQTHDHTASTDQHLPNMDSPDWPKRTFKPTLPGIISETQKHNFLKFPPKKSHPGCIISRSHMADEYFYTPPTHTCMLTKYL